MNKISKSVIGKIKTERIKPRPRWHFILNNILLWVAVTFTMLLGSLTTGVIFQEFIEADWEIANYLNGKLLSFFLIAPYIWFLLLGFVLLIAIKIFKSTEKGYRYSPIFILSTTILISMVGGIFFYTMDIADNIERKIILSPEPYAQWQKFVERKWLAPDKGVLIGRIVEIDSNRDFILRDPNGNLWNVDISYAYIPSGFVLKIDMNMLIVGEKIGEKEFRAMRIRQHKRVGSFNRVNRFYVNNYEFERKIKRISY